ncbi:MAG: hypothetical protein KM310_00730 [Clostridiales bacterium]|nr:hypothetical protein [Clostridiales bacterium]
MTHRCVEDRSIRFHQLVAEKLRADPQGVLAKARRNLAHMRQEHGPNFEYYAARWEALLDGPLDALLAVLTFPDEAARALRQYTPFAGVLSPQERWAAFRQFVTDWRTRHAQGQLEHLIGAAGAILGDDALIIIGSQAILAKHPARLPPEATASMEAVIVSLNAPDGSRLRGDILWFVN